MTRAIGKHLRDFVAIIALVTIALGVASYILANQRFSLPGWVPGIGSDAFTLHGEFQTAKAITPGQGQTVTIAGVDVGEISKVELVEGRARVQMQIQPRFAARIRTDTTMLLRPKTGLEDMTIEMSPGVSGRRVPEGWTVPIQNTLPDVKFEQILAALDRDTRDYLRLLIAGVGGGLDGAGDDLAATFKRFEPGARDLRRITSALEDRRTNIRRSINNLRELVEAVGEKDQQLTELVDSSNAVFRSFAAQDRNLRAALQELPPALSETSDALARVDDLATTMGPALQDLRPAARALGPTLRQVRPFVRETTPVVRDQLRPFARDVRPTVASLRPAARDLAEVAPDLTETFRVLNYLVNELAYNPPGPAEEGYLFWASWANHLGTLLFGSQDAHGPIRRGTVLLSCSTSQVLNTIIAADPRLGMLTQLTGLPQSSQICPAGSGTAGAGAGTPGAEDGTGTGTGTGTGEDAAGTEPAGTEEAGG
jgi:phospholipid/cholesterol/gamma-HCH transport system substrate-binding protein